MKKLLYLLLLVPFITFADEVTSTNQLNQTFTNNAWSGTNKSSRHGSGTIAGVNDKYVVHDDVSLKDDVGMSEAQIQNGWTSTAGAKIWHWNTATSTTRITQTITDSLGNITTQIREVTLNSCGYTNCGSFTTSPSGEFTDSHTQGTNSATDFDIAVRFDFEESTNNTGHWGVDLKQPTLKITYEQNPVSQTTVEEIEEAAEEIEEAIEAFENQEIGSTTFQEMVENIIVDTGLDMELTFEEPEMDMEEYLVMEDDLEVGTVEQLIEDEMAGVSFVPIEEFEETPNVDMDVEMEEPSFEVEEMPTTFTMEPNMDMEEPSFTEMAEDTFTTAMDTLTDMFNMDMPTDMSEEVATEMLDAMVEMDLPMDIPEDMTETTSDMEMDAPVDMEMEVTEDMDMEEAPVETVAMNNETEMEPEPEPEMEPTMDEPTPEPAPEESTPTAEVEEEAPTPTGGAAAESTEEAPIEEEAPTPTEEAPTPTEEPTETESEPEPTEEAPATSEETPTETEDSQTVESDEETTVAEADTDTSVSETSDTTVSTEVQTIGEKIEKIIAKVNAKLKKVSDRVRAVQIVTLKGMQMDGPQLTSYQKKDFYKDRQMYGGNPDFFQNINTLAQQPIYANVALTSYQNNDPLNKQRLIQHEINYEKNKIMLELRELRGQ